MIHGVGFQVVGMNEYGDGMYSQIVDAKTKGKVKQGLLNVVFNVKPRCSNAV